MPCRGPVGALWTVLLRAILMAFSVLASLPTAVPAAQATAPVGPPAQGAVGGPGAPQQEPATDAPVVRRIRVEGARRYTESQIVGALGHPVGVPLDPEIIRVGVKVLFETFSVSPTVYEVELTPEEASALGGAGIELLIRVVELPVDFEPRFIGNVEIDSEELLGWAGLDDRSELYLHRAPRIQSRLLNRYREEGFYFADVEVVTRQGGIDEESGEEIAPDVIFEIREGPRVRVRDVVLHGNTVLPDKGFWFLRRGLKRLAQLELRGPVLFRLFAKAFVQETLEADILAIREVYRDLGYLDAVAQLQELDFSDDRSWVTVHIAIDEGGQYTIGSLGFEGVERVENPNTRTGYEERPTELLYPEAELSELVSQKVGDVFERRLQSEDARELRKYYGERGHVDDRSLDPWDRWSFLEPRLVFEKDRPVIHVTYRIAQGREIFIREIPITGNLHTEDRVIRRQITVETGQRANPTEIERSRARLGGGGLFSDPRDINHIEPYYRFVNTADPAWKDLEFFVEEGQVLNFNLSGGVSSNNGVFGIFQLEHRNFDITKLPDSPWSLIQDVANRRAFHGAGQTFRVRASPGTQVSFFDIYFLEPDLFRHHQDRISLSLTARRNLRIFDSHDEERRQLGFRLGRQVTADSSVFLGYTYGSVEVDDLDTSGEPTIGSPLTVPQDLKDQEGKNDLSYFTVGYQFRRLDSRLFPRNGLSISFQSQFYDEAIGSDFEFIKNDFTIDWYDEFDEDPELVSSNYHIGLGLGAGFGYGDTDEVPYTERYFLGGQRTLRGFDFRGVGPNENGFAQGGQTMAYGTLEYRIPLVKQTQPGTYREIETIHGGVFLDWGILDPEDFSLDLDELRVSAGILFGLSVPLPITFSLGWDLRSGDGDDTRVVSFGIGRL